MNLSAVFVSIAHKRLVAVDLPGAGSNQHELNGVAGLKDFFSTTERVSGQIAWHYFADDADPAHAEGDFTFYDARARSAARTGRSEWRFYYKGDFLSKAAVGDWFILARTTTGRLLALVVQNNSAWLRAAQTLLGIEDTSPAFDTLAGSRLRGQELELLRRQILESLGIELALPVPPTDEEIMVAKFGRFFPSTKEMSAFARTQVETDPFDLDGTLLRWLDREEQLFRALESLVIRERLVTPFRAVDDFITFSLSVQNRRKSRMGHALQNHLEHLFRQRGLRFTPQAKTEGNNRPDFIFAGEREYHDANHDAGLLVMLGVKSTSKDRWRQVLDEADRIPEKHLCTLEAGISVKQTEAMHHRRLTLVVPSRLHTTYTRQQRSGMLDLREFVDFVSRKQNPRRP
jgi:hypothetical protein